MVYEEIILDADFCIKIGASSTYLYLEKLLPLLAHNIYIHSIVYNEVRIPNSAKMQLDRLISKNQLQIIDETSLNPVERLLYDETFNMLSKIMMDNHNPNKNKGETCSLSLAKTKSISIFATDEKDLQPIIDKNLNIGNNDISCVRIIDIIQLIKEGKIIEFSRRDAKALWILSGKKKEDFDKHIWRIS